MMTEDRHTENSESLGEYLRRSRHERDLSFEEVLAKTRIPKKALQAMEEDDYGQLPADAFARGFYVLYAKHLLLDPNEVLHRFDQERETSPVNRHFAAPSKQEKRVNTMAARPSMATGATLAFSLVVIIAAIALLSWYFSWNPATFISSKLQNFQDPAPTEMQGTPLAPDRSAARGQSQDLNKTNHFLTIYFLEDTTITIAIDNGLPEKEAYAKGSTRSWYADRSISLILPAEAKVDLLFNGSQLQLPQPRDGVISLSLP